MRVTAAALASLSVLFTTTDAFRPLHVSRSTTSRIALKSQNKLHEFDYLLGENSDGQAGQQFRSRRRIYLNDDSGTVLASTTIAAPAGMEEEAIAEAVQEEVDPYAEIGLEEATPQLTKIQDTDQSFSTKIENKLKTMDLQDVVSTLIIPSIIAFAGLRWGFNKVAGRVSDSKDATLDDFASELIYHDGDFEEMKLCHSDYSKKLMWLGPKKTDIMLQRYLELYSKKRTVSPQAISLFKLSEEKAAQVLVSTCRAMGDLKISSAGKLLFFGSRILKSPEGKAALQPIKDMIKATYREATVAETMVETSQQAMAEAAYRTAILAAGKNQKSLTVGWEVLGLTKEVATRIFEDESKEGFLSDREKMYGGQSQKYDAKGRPIDKEGKLTDPEDQKAAEEEEEEDDQPASNVYECSECGYTLFIAKGREFKFYGEDFKCPECGAAKDKFNARDLDSE